MERTPRRRQLARSTRGLRSASWHSMISPVRTASAEMPTSVCRRTPRSGAVRPTRAPKRVVSHELRLFFLALASGFIGVLVALVLLWTGAHDDTTRWTLTILITVLWLGFALAVRSNVVRPLQTLSNMQSALREGDFSFRIRGAKSGDALGELMLEVNALSDMLREQRLGAMEATAQRSRRAP